MKGSDQRVERSDPGTLFERYGEILARLSMVPVAGHKGPYTEDQLKEAEEIIGRAFVPGHRVLLEKFGGKFTFELGAVDVGDSGHNVALFLGIGDGAHNLTGIWEDYRGQVPSCYYPFAKDHWGHLFLLDDEGHVRYVELQEGLWDNAERPRASGRIVSASFEEFMDSLRLPEWAVN